MSSPRYAALGWNLPHPQILAADPRSPDAWNQAAAVFVSTTAISALWDLATPGRPARFQSAADEARAWERVEVLARNLRRVLRRGGLVVCRLDAPSPACRVRCAPRSRCFPAGKRVTSYAVLSVVHPSLAAWLADCRAAKPGSAAGACEIASPFVPYLDELCAGSPPAATMAAQVATDPSEALAPDALLRGVSPAQALVRDARGRVLAAADDSVVVLPQLEASQGEREAELLVAAVEQALAVRPAPTSNMTARPAISEQDPLRRRERELDAQIDRLRRERELVRRALRQRETLATLLEAHDDPAQFSAAVTQALAILGLPAPAAGTAAGGLIVEIDRDPQAGPAPQFVVSGRVKRSKGRKREAAAVAEAPRRLRLAPAAVEPGGMPGSPLPDDASRGETLVPAAALFDAAMTVLAHPENETLHREVRDALTRAGQVLP